jgi:DNA-binding MarR family transcriptional regulator
MAAATAAIPRTRDVSARWTPNLARDGWTPVADVFLDNYRKLGLSNLEAMFVIHLVRHKWSSAMPFPGFKRLATRMGLTSTAVRTHARNLEKKGLIKRVKRSGSSNTFDMTELFQQLERLQLSAAKEQASSEEVEDKIEQMLDEVAF